LPRLPLDAIMRPDESIELSRQADLSLNHQSLFLRIVRAPYARERSSGFFISDCSPFAHPALDSALSWQGASVRVGT
jgi:hypothetical protein